MNTTKIALFAAAAVVVAGGLVLAIRMNPSTSTDGAGTIAKPTAAQMNEVSAFTNIATIPVTADPSTIRFEKLKMVELASKTKTTSDPQACKDMQFRDPGTNCQATVVVEKVKALEASYSFNGREIQNGETIPGRDTFSVYFRPEEVSIDGPVDKMKRDAAASLFQVSTYRPVVEQKVIDKQHTHYCEGNYVDGNWVRTDPKCVDQVQFVSQNVPSPYLTVQVDVRRPVAMASH